MLKPIIRVLVLPGGRLPKQGRPGKDVGYDTSVNAIVNGEIDPVTHARGILWDFKDKPDKSIEERNIIIYQDEPAYILWPGESVRIGFGLIFGMTPEWFAYTTSRSSSANKALGVRDEGYDYFNHVPIDPDFRGEICSEMRLDPKADRPIFITKGSSFTQIVFMREADTKIPRTFFRPELLQVYSLTDLGGSGRGINWNGSSNSKGDEQQMELFT